MHLATEVPGALDLANIESVHIQPYGTMENPRLHYVLKGLLWPHRETQAQCGLLLLCSDLCSRYKSYSISCEAVFHSAVVGG